MRAIEGTLRTRGEVTFTSREVGRLADTEPYLLNTALYYALELASGRYVDTNYEPTYLEDTAEVADELYVSPAAPVPGTSPTYVTTTYSPSRDEYVEVNYSAQDDPYEKQNLPSYGRRRSLTHGTELRFFLLARGGDPPTDRLPTYIRLGKKRGKARVEFDDRPVSEQSGEYRLNHPISAYDSDQAPVGNVVTKSMRPAPLVLQGDYDGTYLSIDRADVETPPDRVRLPADLRFLKSKI
jgi:CRISPR-associated protein Csc1